MKTFYCRHCDYHGQQLTVTPGSFIIEIILWCFYIIPGLIYSVWRCSARKKVCPECKSEHMIPIKRKRFHFP